MVFLHPAFEVKAKNCPPEIWKYHWRELSLELNKSERGGKRLETTQGLHKEKSIECSLSFLYVIRLATYTYNLKIHLPLSVDGQQWQVSDGLLLLYMLKLIKHKAVPKRGTQPLTAHSSRLCTRVRIWQTWGSQAYIGFFKTLKNIGNAIK